MILLTDVFYSACGYLTARANGVTVDLFGLSEEQMSDIEGRHLRGENLFLVGTKVYTERALTVAHNCPQLPTGL